jgi:hypothetical protein
MIPSALKDIFRVNLGVKKHERVLVFTDSISVKEDLSGTDRERRTKLASLALLTAEVGKTFCRRAILPIPPPVTMGQSLLRISGSWPSEKRLSRR